MKRYEYKVVVVYTFKQQEMNEEGKSGWELITVAIPTNSNRFTLIYKREIPQQIVLNP